ALLNHITGGHVETIDAGPRSYQPMNVNFGLFPPFDHALPPDENGKRLRGPAKALARKQALTRRALEDLAQWIGAARMAAERCACPLAVAPPQPLLLSSPRRRDP